MLEDEIIKVVFWASVSFWVQFVFAVWLVSDSEESKGVPRCKNPPPPPLKKRVTTEQTSFEKRGGIC